MYIRFSRENDLRRAVRVRLEPCKGGFNLEKHNVSFEMVEQFEFGTCVTTEDNRQDYEEDRYIALGFIGERLHVLVFTLRHMNREVGTFWVISFRKANRREIDMSVKQKNDQAAGKDSWKKREEAASDLVGIRFATAGNFQLKNVRVEGVGIVSTGGSISIKGDSASPKDRARRAAEAMSHEEDAAITSAAQADPDAQPVDELFARRGRPRLANPKQPVLLRIDPEVVSRFKAGGEGWQTRMNEALRKAVGLD